MRQFRTKKLVLEKICHYFTDFSKECGGVISLIGDIIVDFYPLDNIATGNGEFSFSFDRLNEINNIMEKNNQSLGGIIHSHASGINGSGINKPSKNDLEFYKNFMNANPIFDELLFPIVCLLNNQIDIKWYIYQDNKLNEIEMAII